LHRSLFIFFGRKLWKLRAKNKAQLQLFAQSSDEPEIQEF
jgi:hypothetical protein